MVASYVKEHSEEGKNSARSPSFVAGGGGKQKKILTGMKAGTREP